MCVSRRRQPDIEQSVWNDPHVGLDHGFVEWARVVVDEQVMLAVPATHDSDFEVCQFVLRWLIGCVVVRTHRLIAGHARAWAPLFRNRTSS